MIIVSCLALIAGGAWISWRVSRDAVSPDPLDEYYGSMGFWSVTIPSLDLADATLSEAVDVLNREVEAMGMAEPRFRVWKDGDALPALMRLKQNANASTANSAPPGITLSRRPAEVMSVAYELSKWFNCELAGDGKPFVFCPAGQLEYRMVEQRYYLMCNRSRFEDWFQLPHGEGTERVELKEQLAAQGIHLGDAGEAYYDPVDHMVFVRGVPGGVLSASANFWGGCTGLPTEKTPLQRWERRLSYGWYRVMQPMRDYFGPQSQLSAPSLGPGGAASSGGVGIPGLDATPVEQPPPLAPPTP
jgi:hypothetical protein